MKERGENDREQERGKMRQRRGETQRKEVGTGETKGRIQEKDRWRERRANETH